MIVKKHIAQDRRLVLAVCDNDILGKAYSENDLQIDLSSDFYKGERMDEDMAAGLMKKAFVINIAGEKSVALAQKLGFIDKDSIIRIQGIPHAQALISEDL